MENADVTSSGDDDPPPYCDTNATAIPSPPPMLTTPVAGLHYHVDHNQPMQPVMIIDAQQVQMQPTPAPTAETFVSQVLLSCFTIWCCCPLCGIIAYIL